MMVQFSEPVNNMSSENSTIEERLRLERERLKLSQPAVYSRLAVSKGTYIKYESGETSPSARHLAILADMGFDIYYIVVGERSANELGAELGNLIAAYTAASDDLQDAALAVLLARYNPDIGAAQVIPNYFEDKIRHRGGQPSLNAGGQKLSISGGNVGQVVQGGVSGGSVVIQPHTQKDDSKKRR